MTKYKHPVCRGSPELGSACGHCERCIENGYKFRTPDPLPNARENEILTLLIEECSEIIKRVCKAKRFGLDQVQPGHHLSNRVRIGMEIGDLLEVIALAQHEDLILDGAIQLGRIQKAKKLVVFMQTDVSSTRGS